MGKVLVLGAAGMAGHMVYTLLKENTNHDVLGTVNSNNFSDASITLNIYSSDSIRQIIKEIKPDFVVNCIGILINGSKSNPSNAIYVNSYFPHLLAEICSENSCRLIHISTDCVFSGDTGNYNETSLKDAKDVYGKSKDLGEVVNSEHLTIRTSIIGPDLRSPSEGLFDWFMRQENSVNGYKSAYWSGVTTLELAKFIIWTMDNYHADLIHLTNNQPINKFDLLTLFNKVYNRGLNVTNITDYKINKSFINTNEAIKYRVPSYEKMLDDQKTFMQSHSHFYKNYKI